MKNYGAVIFLVSIILFTSCRQKNRETTGETSNHPNVVLILADDQGWGDLSSHGNQWVNTPNIDNMAEEGASFDHFYVSPLCAPTRASLLTGRYYLRTGTSWVSKGLENMDPDELTLGEVFKLNGYVTGCFGKWHNGAHYPQHPNQQGFEEFIGFCAGHWNNYFNTSLQHNGDSIKATGYITDFLTNQALRFIKTNKGHNFFCYIPYNVPHSPFQVPDQYFDKYKAMGLDDKNACVYGMCEDMDWNVGRIISTLDSLGISDNTIVIFLSDNGPNGERYNGGMLGIKGSIHEGGVRVPCFIQWKGKITPNNEISQLAAHIDILPTLVSLCQLTPPETQLLDGRDLSDILLGKKDKMEERLIFSKKSTERIIPDGAARSDQYRFEIDNGDSLLFDMVSDPAQKYNLASTQHAVMLGMARAYNAWYQEIMQDYQPQTEIRIGYPAERKAYLPAHEAGFSGTIHYKEGHGWAHDWLVNWTQPTDSIFWDVLIEKPTAFNLSVLYSCPASDVGTVLEGKVGDDTVAAQLITPHNPDFIPSPDRVKRQEVYEKVWARLSLGKIQFLPGHQTIVLRAKSIPGVQVGEIKGLVLDRVSEE